MKILHVVGARPNFMKVAPVYLALARHRSVQQLIVHTGQHYDLNMSDVFFQELGLGAPEHNLEVGSGSHGTQTAQIMQRFEPVVLHESPDCVLVYGDVNSTIASALVCAKLSVTVGHVEAGLRSFDRAMPEEINRLLTDQISELLFTPSEDANRNLEKEGIASNRVHFVGNVMIDSLIRILPKAELERPDGIPDRYALVTLHRPSNVDDTEWLAAMLKTLSNLAQDLAIVFPMHPRTRERIRRGGLSVSTSIRILNPVPYGSFLWLEKHAAVVITDSGGIQEETTFLGVPCLTVRENTERPVTLQFGTNQLVGRDLTRLANKVSTILSPEGARKERTIPPLWDGHASDRIAEVLIRELRGRT